MKSMTFIEKQTGSHIRALRSDGEFDSHHLKDLCWEAGIKRELSVPYNPQQNGVAERKNRTICEAAKAMMHDLDLLPLSGQKLPGQQSMFIIDVHTSSLDIKLLRRSLQVSNLIWNI